MWTQIEQWVKVFGWLMGVGGAIFLAGRFFQRMMRGELGDSRLSPLQRLSVDLERLSETVKAGMSTLEKKLDTQYTDLVQRVNADHLVLRELKQARDTEYERLSVRFPTKELIDRMAKESQDDRNDLHAKFKVFEERCFSNHRRAGD